MNRLTTLLVMALAAQLLITAALFWPRQNPGETSARAALLSLPGESVDRIVIESGDESLLLARQGDRWLMPEYHGLPVQQARVDRVLVDLPALPRGWPVANSQSALERFEVAPEKFQRKIGFFSGEDDRGELYIGTSPGFRKVHVSPAGDERVFAVEFNTFELPLTAGEWLDKTLLQLGGVEAVQGVDYSLVREGDAWTGADGREAAADEVDKLINGLESLRVTGAADIATASLLQDAAAPPTLIVESGGATYEFRLYEIEGAYYIQRGDIPVFFSLGAVDYDRLNDVSAETLYAEADEGEGEEDMPASEDPGDAG